MATPYKMKSGKEGPMRKNFGSMLRAETETKAHSSSNITNDGDTYTKFESNPKSKSQKGYRTEYNKMSRDEKVKQKINPKSNTYQDDKGARISLS